MSVIGTIGQSSRSRLCPLLDKSGHAERGAKARRGAVFRAETLPLTKSPFGAFS